MARSNWASLNDMDLRLTVATRRVAPDHATEFGAFQQSWRDTRGAHKTEYGRYVAFLLRQGDGSRRMGRLFGFEGSTRQRPLTLNPAWTANSSNSGPLGVRALRHFSL